MTKTFPDTALIDALRARGMACNCMWQMRGPKGTLVQWMEGWAVDYSVVIIQTFTGGGWEAYVSSSRARVDDAVEEIASRILRCAA